MPLRFYLATGFLVFSALLLVVLWLFQTVFLEAFYKSVKTGQVKSCAYSVADRIDSSDLEDTIADIEDQNGMSVAIYCTDSKFFRAVYLTKNRPEVHSMIGMDVAYEMYDKAKENNGEFSRIAKTAFEKKDKKREFNREPANQSATEAAQNSKQAEKRDGSGYEANGQGQNSQAKEQGQKKNQNTGSGETAAPTEPETVEPTEFAAMPDDPFFEDLDDEFAPDIKNGMDNPDSHEPALERSTVDILAFAKIVTSGESEYLVIVESEITPVASVVDTLRYQLIIMTVVIVILSVVMAIIVARVISKPISDAADKAKQLADQNYDLTFSGGRYSEITELNNSLAYAAEELKKVDDLQKELIANISHDLRTPLTMITGYAEIMRDLPGEATPENVQIIIDEANRLNDLVTDLLDISRLRSGTADLKMLPFSLTKCIESTFTRYQKLVENDGLNIIFEHDCEAFVKGDELRMTQVLYNLVNNAVNYIGDDKTVIVRQTVGDGMVKIEVIDHGDGIPQEKLDYIWDRYYRVDKEHQRAVIGTGLGLSIVKNILLAHDADFGVASKLGSGSDFYFSLPVIDVEEEKDK